MPESIPLFWTTLLVALSATIIYSVKEKPKLDSPVLFSIVLYATYFILSPAIEMLTGTTKIGIYDVKDVYFITELIFIAGFLFFLLSYRFTEAKFKKIHFKISTKTLILNAVLWEVIGVIGYIIWTRQLGISLFVINPLKLSNYYLKLGESSRKATGYLALSLLFLIPASLMFIETFIRKVNRVLSITAIILNFTLFFTRGVRYMILIGGGSLLLYYIKRKGIKLKKIQITLLILLFIVVFGFIAYVRGAPSLKGMSVNTDFLLAFFMSSISLFKPTAVLVYYIPHIHPYLLGESFLYTFILPIPRLIWPQKPYPEFLKILWKATGGRFFGYAVPNIGEYYANFGIAGVIVLMALLGFIFRYIYDTYKHNDKNQLILMGYSIFYFFIFQIVSRGYFPQVFVQSIYLFIPLLSLFMTEKILNGTTS